MQQLVGDDASGPSEKKRSRQVQAAYRSQRSVPRVRLRMQRHVQQARAAAIRGASGRQWRRVNIALTRGYRARLREKLGMAF